MRPDAALLAELQDGLAEMSLPLPPESMDKLISYIELLSRWNKIHNLTAIKSTADMVRRHLLDSLSIIQFVEGESLLDVGAGAGLPGIPLAVAKPHLNVTLVDSVQKKTRFMAFAANALGLSNVEVRHQRVETMQHAQGYQMVVARAFSSVDKLCTLTRHLLAPDGRILAMMGQPLEAAQIQDIPRATGFEIIQSEKLFVAGEQAMRNIVVLQRKTD